MCVVTRLAIGFRAGYHHVKLNAVVTKVHYRNLRNITSFWKLSAVTDIQKSLAYIVFNLPAGTLTSGVV